MRVVIVGATSAIAESVARLWAARGDALYLLARREAFLETIAADLRLRGASRVGFERFDILDAAAHAGALERAEAALGGVDCVLIAHGSLPDQAACDADPDLAMREMELNGVRAAGFALRCAAILERQGRGTLVAITSVAGVRGRASNCVYGSAKALLSTLLSGLRQRLARAGVAVVDIRPGFVDTPMTAAFPKGPLWATPGGVAPAIVSAIDRGTAVAYVPWFWRWIMLAIRHVPDFLFRRMKF
jgi:short-subunit dehydrogenase